MDPFVAEVRIFPFNFAPKGWAFCDGQILPLSQNTALFSLLGTTYGGDGKSNFALPNLQGSAVMQPDQGPGLSLHDLGEASGSATVTLLQSEMPAHSHNVSTSGTQGDISTPDSTTLLARSKGGTIYKAPPQGGAAQMSLSSISINGSNFPHNNMMPYLTLNFCIALQGVYPPRT
jgi:microcystin-dependent protein